MRKLWTQLTTCVALACALTGSPGDTHAQNPPPSDPPVDPQPAQSSPNESPKRYDDPSKAYNAGAFDQALQRFVDEQVERPDDPALMMNMGSAYYKMRNYEEAAKAFNAAAVRGTKPLKAQALYNLGNVAFRQGKLQEAIEHYQRSLELNPEDEDAKFNLEYVRNEIRRRHEEAQKQQQNQNQQNQQNQQQQQDQKQGENEQSQQDQQKGEQGDDGKQGEQDQKKPEGGKDSDQDGLSDEQEKNAENPTDPTKADSDGDGLLDGYEDLNSNGKVDPGETDPNKKDSDGDGVSDGEEEKQKQKNQNQGQGTEADKRELTQEEALRYLQALDETTPQKPTRRMPARPYRSRKDW